MNKFFRLFIFTCCVLSSGITSAATSLSVDFSLPEFDKENYRKPYVAMWAESNGESQNLLLWHLTKRDNDKWLVDIRRWWRKAGRYSDNTFDGITGATKSAGKYHVDLDVSKLSKFTLFIEVARQKGGRSIVRQKIDLTNNNNQFTLAATEELGAVTIKVNK